MTDITDNDVFALGFDIHRTIIVALRNLLAFPATSTYIQVDWLFLIAMSIKFFGQKSPDSVQAVRNDFYIRRKCTKALHTAKRVPEQEVV